MPAQALNVLTWLLLECVGAFLCSVGDFVVTHIRRWPSGGQQRFSGASFEKCPGSPRTLRNRRMWPGCREEAVTAENLCAVDAPELLPVSEAGDQCSLIAMDYVAEEPRAALSLVTQQALLGWEGSGKPPRRAWGSPVQEEPAMSSGAKLGDRRNLCFQSGSGLESRVNSWLSLRIVVSVTCL